MIVKRRGNSIESITQETTDHTLQSSAISQFGIYGIRLQRRREEGNSALCVCGVQSERKTDGCDRPCFRSD